MKHTLLHLGICLTLSSLFADIQFVQPGHSGRDNVPAPKTELLHEDFIEAVKDLEQDLQSLSPPHSDKDPLMQEQQKGWHAWVSHWIEENKNLPLPTPETPLPDATVFAYDYAQKVVGLLKNGADTALRGAQMPSRETFIMRSAEGEVHVSFDYVLRIPEQQLESYPLLLIVHGHSRSPNISGGFRDELEDVAQKMQFPFITASVVFNGNMQEKYGWSPDELAGFVESLAGKLPVDRERIYITGFSMGGLGTIRTVAHRPDLFAAYAPLCGRADPEWAQAVKTVPAYLYHGDRDDSIMFCYHSVQFHNALEAAGAQPSLYVYNGVGHAVWAHAYRETAFYQRLLQHSRLPSKNHSPIPAIGQLTKGARLELSNEPELNYPYVCWIDKTFEAAALSQSSEGIRDIYESLMLNYPNLPLIGNILLLFPQGLIDAQSPMRAGIALEKSVSLPEGFVSEHLNTSGSGAVLRYSTDIEDVIHAVHQFKAVSPKANTSDALLLEINFRDDRDGNRYTIYNVNAGK